jgi:hypothetical protein
MLISEICFFVQSTLMHGVHGNIHFSEKAHWHLLGVKLLEKKRANNFYPGGLHA